MLQCDHIKGMQDECKMNAKLSPTELALKLKQKFPSPMMHQMYLTGTNQHLSPLIFKGQQTLIFYPISDIQGQMGLDSIDTLMQKCGHEFLNQYATNDKLQYLIFPITHTESKHWITAIFSIHKKKMIFLDSVPGFSKDCYAFINLFNETFFTLNLQCEIFEYHNQFLQFNATDCGYWTLVNIEYFDKHLNYVNWPYNISEMFDSYSINPTPKIDEPKNDDTNEDGFIDVLEVSAPKIEPKPYPHDLEHFYQLRFEVIKNILNTNMFNEQFLLQAIIDLELLIYQGNSIKPSTSGTFKLSEIFNSLDSTYQLDERSKSQAILIQVEHRLAIIYIALRDFTRNTYLEKYLAQYDTLFKWGNKQRGEKLTIEKQAQIELFNPHLEKFSQDILEHIKKTIPSFNDFSNKLNSSDEIIYIAELSCLEILIKQRHWHLLRVALEIGLGVVMLNYTSYFLNLASIQLPILNQMVPAIIFALACLDLIYQVKQSQKLVANNTP